MKRFRRVLSLLVLFVFAVGAFAPTLSPAQNASRRSANAGRNAAVSWPNGLFSENEYDYQNIPRNTLAKHSFEFVNRTNGEIRLVSARSSCGCTKVYVPTKKTYRPGERGEIIAEIDAIRYTGSRRAVVTAVFDGPTRAEIALQIRGNVVENVRIEPQRLKFIVDETSKNDENRTTAQNSNEKTPENVRVCRTVFTGRSETIVKATSTNPFLRFEIGEPVATRSGVRTSLLVALTDDAPAGYFSDVVYLYTNGPNGATPFPVAVEGVVRPKFSVAPSTLSFAAGEKDEKIVKNVVVAGSKPFTIKKVECSSPAVEIDLRATRAVRTEKDENANVAANGKRAENVVPARPVYVLPVAFDPARLDAESSTALLKIETNDGQILTLEAVLSAAHFARKTESDAESSLGKSQEKRLPKTAVATPVLRGTLR